VQFTIIIIIIVNIMNQSMRSVSSGKPTYNKQSLRLYILLHITPRPYIISSNSPTFCWRDLHTDTPTDLGLIIKPADIHIIQFCFLLCTTENRTDAVSTACKHSLPTHLLQLTPVATLQPINRSGNVHGRQPRERALVNRCCSYVVR
jgi:hypothetical protein